jgi:MFS family permease
MNRTFPPSLYYTLIVSLGGFIFGFDASVISGAIGFIDTEFGLSDWQQGIVVSSPTLGALIAMIFAGAISDAIGRRKALIIIAVLYVVSAVCSALAPSFELLVLARFIGGIAFCSLIIAPMYISEISAPENRGKMVSVNQLNIVLGFAISYFTNYYLLQLSYSDADWIMQLGISTQTWRYMLGLGCFQPYCGLGYC